MNLTLVKKVVEAKGTKTFIFKSDKKVNWKSGQYIYITLPKLKYKDERGETRHFTISSSPTENIIQITTRVRKESGYKKTLDKLPIGTVCEGKGPEGTFTLNELTDSKPGKFSVFLAGGIGITPFRSFIKYCIDKKLKNKIHLIYSNSDSDFVFKDELDKWQKENGFLKITYFDSSISGHLDAKKLSKLLPSDLMPSAYFYAVGPNAFVNAMEEILQVSQIL